MKLRCYLLLTLLACSLFLFGCKDKTRQRRTLEDHCVDVMEKEFKTKNLDASLVQGLKNSCILSVRDAFQYNYTKRIQCIQKATSSKAIQQCLRSDPK